MPPDVVEYRARAHNDATASANKIHDDAIARRYGFAGGLVPGVTVYGYLTRPPLERWGTAWLERGTMSVRFLAPFYEGEEVVARLDADGGLSGADAAGGVRASGRADLADVAPAVDLARYPEAPLPARPPPASAEALAAVDVLGSVTSTFRAEPADAYGRPAWLLRSANALLAANVVLGPWIHVQSDVEHLGAAHDGEVISTRGRVAGLSERRGHRLVELDVLLVADGDRPVMHARHVAIYQPAERADS